MRPTDDPTAIGVNGLQNGSADNQNDGSAGSAGPVAVEGGERNRTDGPEKCPIPPTGIAQYILDGLGRQSPEELRMIADYAERLTTWKEQAAADQADSDDKHDDVAKHENTDNERPSCVPGKASVVVKEIDGNRYEYWQWWEDGGTKSQYKGPVSSE